MTEPPDPEPTGDGERLKDIRDSIRIGRGASTNDGKFLLARIEQLEARLAAPKSVHGDGRLLLNAYGRQCWESGHAMAKAEAEAQLAALTSSAGMERDKLHQQLAAKDAEIAEAKVYNNLRDENFYREQRQRVQAQADVSSLTAALLKLTNEVSGLIGAWENDLRAAVGNTNLSTLKFRRDEARAALQATQEPKP